MTCSWRKPLVDALLDLLRHHCITVRIDGPSRGCPKPAVAYVRD